MINLQSFKLFSLLSLSLEFRKILLTAQTVSNWEVGQRMPRLTPKQMLTLCRTLKCELEELANYEEKLKS